MANANQFLISSKWTDLNIVISLMNSEKLEFMVIKDDVRVSKEKITRFNSKTHLSHHLVVRYWW